MLLARYTNAQDTVQLHLVEVNAGHNELYRIGKRTETIDSTTKEQFRFQSLAELLGFNSQVSIKSYGPGALASTSMRGGNASQTAVLWNGFNLQNTMLGQGDLALMPSALFENVEVEYGGSSALWGSGAVGGSIHLNNKALFAQGLRSGVSLSGGNIGNNNLGAYIVFSKKKWVTSTKLYSLYSQNKYSFLDTLNGSDQLKKQTHASYSINGLIQEFKCLTGKYSVLQINGWLSTNNREIAGSVFSPQNYGLQNDKAQRVSGNWTFEKRKLKSTAKAAAFNDVIEYRQNSDTKFSVSKVLTLMAESENYSRWGNGQLFNFGIAFASSSGTSENYISQKQLSRISALAGNKFSLFNGTFVANVALRAEHFNTGNSPLTGNLSFDYKPVRSFTLSISAARIYRQPTLNELFWLPGGNIHLKPEQGNSYESNIAYTLQKNRISFFVSGSAYSRLINNWILWVPGAGGNPSPQNLEAVWSRGTETSWKIEYTRSKLKCGICFLSAYVLSTVQSSNAQHVASAGKQLIYTPRYTINGSIFASYHKSYICLYQQYTGYRFTSSDNLQWLPPYWLSSLRISQRISATAVNLDFFFACHNLFNSNYSLVAGRPTPLRNFETGLSIHLKKQHKDTKP